MARRAGSKGSRSERRAGKERASRARDRGLPERQGVDRARALGQTATPELDGAVGGSGVVGQSPRGVPAWLWVAGVAAALLAGAYVLSARRDEALIQARPDLEATPTSAASAPSNEPRVSEPASAEPASAEPMQREPAPAAEPAPSSPPDAPRAPAVPTVALPSAPAPVRRTLVAPRAAAPVPPAVVSPPAVAAPKADPPPAVPLPAEPSLAK